MGDRKRVVDYIMDIVLVAGMSATLFFLTRNMLSSLAANLDPEKEKHDQARLKAQANLKRLLRSRGPPDGDEDEEDEEDEEDGSSGAGGQGRRRRQRRQQRRRPEELELNEYENMIALEVVPPEDISVGFDDIGGLNDIIEELKESVIYPLTLPHLYSHAAPLLSAPSGVLLYGPPGCGKTMLAKALAHESGASFINLHISTLTEKWYGDSNKMVRAVFSLARKLQPAIIFIDEIDAVLGTRRSGEHEASGMVKAEFMTLWDGLTSSNAAGVPSRIVVLGATNRIHDIDEAILRRMPKKFPVPLPDVQQRRRILQLVLGETKRDDAHFDLEYVARVTNGMSGSDLKELCRDAAMMPMREYLRAHRATGQSLSKMNPANLRGIRTDDFFGRVGLRNAEDYVPEAEAANTNADADAAVAAVAAAAAAAMSQAASASQTAEDEMSSRRRSYRRHSSSAKRAAGSKSAAASSSRRSVTGTTPAGSNDDDDEYEDVVDEPEKATATV